MSLSLSKGEAEELTLLVEQQVSPKPSLKLHFKHRLPACRTKELPQSPKTRTAAIVQLLLYNISPLFL